MSLKSVLNWNYCRNTVIFSGLHSAYLLGVGRSPSKSRNLLIIRRFDDLLPCGLLVHFGPKWLKSPKNGLYGHALITYFKSMCYNIL